MHDAKLATKLQIEIHRAVALKSVKKSSMFQYMDSDKKFEKLIVEIVSS